MRKIVLPLISIAIIVIFIMSMIALVYHGIFPLNAKHFPGYYGDFCIPSVGIDVPCVLVDGDADGSMYLQFIVNQKNCAAIFWMSTNVITNGEEYGAWYIGDHNDQSFKTLVDCEVGAEATLAYADGHIERYIVTKSFTGHNIKSDIVDENMESVLDDNLGGIILYTCLDSWENVQIVFLQPVDD